MSERYSRLFFLPENLYAATSPVVIAAGALLKDNQTGNILAQLKMRNIGAKAIKAVKVSVCPFDPAGASLGSGTEHQYLDLSARFGEDFGAKTPIPLADAATRSFSAAVKEVVFEDNGVWRAADEPWEPLPAPEVLEISLPDAEMVKQYRIKYGANCKYAPVTHKDLWLCPCGKWNRQERLSCGLCQKSAAGLRAFDLAKLQAERDARLAAEAEAAAAKKAAAEAKAREEKAAAEARAKRAKKVAKRAAIILAVLLVVGIVSFFAVTKVITPNGKYNDAVALMEAGQYEEAITAFEAMDGYKDSTEKIADICGSAEYAEYLAEKLKDPKVGSCVTFGAYEQDNDTSNGKEAIEWFVLDIQDEKALLISKYALDCQPYNTSYSDITWENCSLRKWLNSDFLNAAFTIEEQEMIPTVTVPADKNPEYETNPGSTTQDRVFLLSIAEAEKYFTSNSAKQCTATDYAAANGAVHSYGGCRYWLRSPGSRSGYAAYTFGSGDIITRGDGVPLGSVAVRPAIWVDLGA